MSQATLVALKPVLEVLDVQTTFRSARSGGTDRSAVVPAAKLSNELISGGEEALALVVALYHHKGRQPYEVAGRVVYTDGTSVAATYVNTGDESQPDWSYNEG